MTTYQHGDQVTPPSNAVKAHITAYGQTSPDSGGDAGIPGTGAYIKTTIEVTGSDTLYIDETYGGNGGHSSGGGPSEAGDGGNSIDVRKNGTSLSDRVVVAGGGGGGADAHKGGDAGYPSGETGESYSDVGGDPGTQSSGYQKGNGEDGTSSTYTDPYGTSYPETGGGGAGYYGGYAGDINVDVGSGGGGGSSYTVGTVEDHGLVSDSTNELTVDITWTTVTTPDSPENVNPTVDANDQISLNWSAPTSGGTVDNYRIQINRDDNGWENPSGGPTTSGSTSGTYGPDSDTAYGRQVGIDSKFRFRVRSENAGGESGWTYSSWVYTDPIPPHNPSVSRPDADTFEISATMKTDTPDRMRVDYRLDTGGGYGSWNFFDMVHGGEETSGSVTTTGSRVTRRYNVGSSYQSGHTLQSDARYQFRLQTRGPANDYSEIVYADYGNEGNVYLEDDFESGDLSKWKQEQVFNGASDSDSGIQSGGFSDLGINGADQGTYYCRLDAGDDIRKVIGSISSDTDVIVRAVVATGSMDSGGEQTRIEWYDGSNYQTLRSFSHEYNKQGWTQVAAVVPSSYLNSNNHVRFRGYGGGGDHFAVDRVVVSDILHEFTKPAAPSDLQLTTDTQGEISYSFTDNFSFPSKSSLYGDLDTNDDSDGDIKNGGTTGTFTGLLDGEQYQVRARNSPIQYRHGELSNYWDVTTAWQTATTILSSDTDISTLPESNTEVGLSWTANQNNGSRTIYFRQSGASSWNNYSSVSIETESEQIDGLNEDTEYEFKTNVSTEHVSKDSSIDSATTFLFITRTVESFSNPISTTIDSLLSTSIFAESHSNVLGSSVKRNIDYSRSQTSHSEEITSSADLISSYVRDGDSFADSMTSFTYTDRTSLEMIDYRVDWNDDEATWYTNWFQETRITGDEDNLALRPKVVDGAKEPAAKVQVQYDRNGDGIPDEETRIIEIGKEKILHQIDDIPISESGQYRLKIMDYSGFNSLISIDFGIVH